MIVRSASRCASKIRVPASRPLARYARPQCRRFSTPASGAPQASTSNAGMLAPFTNELDRIAPSFKINGSQIKVLQTPAEFYETLKDKIRNAEGRIFLATLYIGKSETELVSPFPRTLWLGRLTPIDRDAARDPSQETQRNAQHPDRCPSRHSRSP